MVCVGFKSEGEGQKCENRERKRDEIGCSKLNPIVSKVTNSILKFEKVAN